MKYRGIGPKKGAWYFGQAVALKATIDDAFIRLVTYQLLGYENEFGVEATRVAIQKLIPYVGQVGDRRSIR